MSTRRIVVSSGTESESAVGYSRAVRIGPHVVVSGTTGTGPAEDMAAQTREALRRIGIALNEVAALIAPELLVEIEPDAYSPADGKLPSAVGR
jgi:enamine deaminase RidA (YjgF/YER057c/UK114 family)